MSDLAVNPDQASDNPDLELSDTDSSAQPVETDSRKPILDGTKGTAPALVWASAFLIIIAGVIAYSNSFVIPFHYYDQQVLLDGIAQKGLANAFADPDFPHIGPVTAVSLAINWKLTPMKPAGFHAVNLALHLLTAVFLFLLCRKLFSGKLPEPVAMLSGLLFALHPALTESVNLVSMRGSLLCGFFSLTAMLLHLRATRNMVSGPWDNIRPWALGIAWLAFLAAWGSRETAFILPLLFIAADWVIYGANGLRARRWIYLTYCALLCAMLLLRLVLSGSHATPDPQKILALITVMPEHLRVILTGRDLSFIKPDPTFRGLAASSPWPGLGLTLFVTAVGGFLLWKRSVAGFALIMCLLALIAGSVFPSADAAWSERQLYLPLAGMLIIAPWLFAAAIRVQAARKVLAIAAIALAVTAAAGTFMRNGSWNDEAELWTEAQTRAPSSPLVRQQLGLIYLQRGQNLLMGLMRDSGRIDSAALEIEREAATKNFATAEDHFRAAIDMDAQNASLHQLLGSCLILQGKPNDARLALLDALRIDPEQLEATHQLARLYRALPIPEDAPTPRIAQRLNMLHSLDYYKRLDTLASAHNAPHIPPDYLLDFAMTLAALGHPRQAESTLIRFADIVPDSVQTEDSPVKKQLAQMKEVADQIDQLEQKATQPDAQNPDAPTGYFALAQALMIRQRILPASYVLDTQLNRVPSDGPAWLYLAYLRSIMGASSNFLNEFPTPPEPPQGQPLYWVQLARMCAAEGRWDDANAFLRSPQAAPSIPMPDVTAGQVAMSLGMAQEAEMYFRQATEQHTENPEPWLSLCDLALAMNDRTSARGYLAEAEKRNPDPQALATRREAIERPVAPVGGDGTTVIR